MNTNTDVVLDSAGHQTPLSRALTSLEGLSVGDAFGQSFFSIPAAVIESRFAGLHAPPPPWFYTDDTVMAKVIVECLARHGKIDRDWLAAHFASEYLREPKRGYGGTAHGILRAIGEGTPWKQAAGRVFDGQGSCGNGGAMRAAPLGAYFAEHEISVLVEEARASAQVTHANDDGQAGAVAVALAAFWLLNEFRANKPVSHEMIKFVMAHMPQTETYWRLKKALTLPLELSPKTAALILGNGSQVISSDTVPFCLWLACRDCQNLEEALWNAVSVYGDMDTNCAIVGSLVVLSAGLNTIPQEWLDSREALDLNLPEQSAPAV